MHVALWHASSSSCSGGCCMGSGGCFSIHLHAGRCRPAIGWRRTAAAVACLHCSNQVLETIAAAIAVTSATAAAWTARADVCFDMPRSRPSCTACGGTAAACGGGGAAAAAACGRVHILLLHAGGVRGPSLCCTADPVLLERLLLRPVAPPEATLQALKPAAQFTHTAGHGMFVGQETQPKAPKQHSSCQRKP